MWNEALVDDRCSADNAVMHEHRVRMRAEHDAICWARTSNRSE